MKVGKVVEEYVKNIPNRLLNKEQYKRIVSCYTYAIMALIATTMSVINMFTPVGVLLYATTAIAILNILNFILSLATKKCVSIAGYLFAVEIIVVFTFFVVSGNPKGFSIIWLTLLPPISMLFYGKKGGTFLSVLMLLILIFFLWTPVGSNLLMEEAVNNYTETFKLRFPFLYTACCCLAYILSTIQNIAIKAVEDLSAINKHMAITDQLTGLYNRSGLQQAIEEEKRYLSSKKIGVAIIDIDKFKMINDDFGHQAGDALLKGFANILTKNLKATACRWGGDEFLLFYFDDEVNKDILEKFREEVSNTEFVIGKDNYLRITISGGVFETTSNDISLIQKWIKRADDALYISKHDGRDQITYS